MRIPYCTCQIQSKEVFRNGPFIAGWSVDILLIGILCYIAFSQSYVYLLFLLLFAGILVPGFIGYLRQALLLGHSKACAKRYAVLAAVCVNRGYHPEYANLKGYKSLLLSLLESLFGKRKAKRIRRRMMFFGGFVLTILILLMSYEGLTRQRYGLEDVGTRYEPVLSEAVWLALGFLALGLASYIWLRRRIARARLLWGGIIIVYSALWLAVIYGLSIYARVSFGEKIFETFGIFAAVAIIFVPILWIEKLVRRRRRLRRRRK